MYMILFILDDAALLDEVLDAWYNIGVGGTTIFESTGIHRRRAKRLSIPIRYLLPDVSDSLEGNKTLLAVVPNEEIVQKCMLAAEGIVGDLSQPNTGVFASWPLGFVKGIPKNTSW
jgi:hypothetical protein